MFFKFTSQVAIFSAITGSAFAVNQWSGSWFAVPATHNPETAALEHKKYHFPGDKRDPLFFNHSQNSTLNWPKWDRRDDPEDNVFHIATSGAAPEEEEEDEE